LPVICAAAALEAGVDQTIHYEDTSCAGAVAASVIRQGKIARNRNGNCTPYAACRAIVFLVIAIIAALFGFGVIASAAAGIAKILFFIFLVVFIISLIFGLSRRGTSV
jgi:uncharacterized membrane protein YtjA (UPF0391 family)